MKIRALRVAECGRFVEPVALEGLSGGLDLLIGPNEAGKSTLLKALRLALLTSHRSAKAELGELKPYRGGSPLIEIELEIGNERWRVRKRFLAERMAEVTSLSTGTLMRGSDAETKLEQLLDLKSGVGRFPLLWLAQGALLAEPGPDEAGESTLRAAIAREVTSAAGGEGGRRIRTRVQAALGEFLTPGRGQPTGRYRDAIREVETAAAEVDKCRRLYSEVEGLLDRLANLGDASAKLSDPVARAGRSRRIGDAEARLRLAHEDIAARDQARVAVAEARVKHASSTAAARSLTDKLGELASIFARAEADASVARELEHRLRVAESANEDAAGVAERARSALDAAEADLKRATALARYQELAGRVARARGGGARIGALEERLRGEPLDEASVREARALSSSLAEAAARLEASSSAVKVDYEGDTAPRIVVDGRPILAGERLVAFGRLVLHIPGIGHVTVEPAASSDRQRLLARQDEHRSALALILAGWCATDLAELERRHTSARETAAELAEARAALSVAAPDGLARLEEEIAAFPLNVDNARQSSPGPDRQQLADTASSLRDALQAADAALRQSTATGEALRREAAVHASRVEERDRRRAEVESGLPTVAERDRLRADAQSAADTASRGLDEALRIEAAWAQRTPDTAALAVLEAEVGEARREQHRAEQEEAALASERARLEGMLEAARREDVVARLAELESESARVCARHADLAEEVAALKLLDGELATEEARLRDSYLAPVLARLTPYVDLVFPQAAIQLGDKYAVAGLVRNEREETLRHLSDGTREQIAVLTRLAFARLLADQGMGAPLVLDDVLVYSDDYRIGAMHRALEAAAEAHQVIVLSCREQSFAGLRGARIAIVPWNPDAR